MSTYHNSVIKQHLAKSVKLQNEGGCEDFAWKKQVPFPEFGLNGITVEGLGNIPIPVPLQVSWFNLIASRILLVENVNALIHSRMFKD